MRGRSAGTGLVPCSGLESPFSLDADGPSVRGASSVFGEQLRTEVLERSLVPSRGLQVCRAPLQKQKRRIRVYTSHIQIYLQQCRWKEFCPCCTAAPTHQIIPLVENSVGNFCRKYLKINSVINILTNM